MDGLGLLVARENVTQQVREGDPGKDRRLGPVIQVGWRWVVGVVREIGRLETRRRGTVLR
ncbi:hypothetical protein [Kribbella sp. NPDC051770]|uniref:hypothetical protein n=1 Tax=Kribbella sp. NPDC051770 TaxID=3155413 RepID=UPI00343D8422